VFLFCPVQACTSTAITTKLLIIFKGSDYPTQRHRKLDHREPVEAVAVRDALDLAKIHDAADDAGVAAPLAFLFLSAILPPILYLEPQW
jgi:hypothetical protein